MGHACHVPVVEVDVETGRVSFLAYAAVHDCGTLVNPRSLAGHILGGTAQGIGTALYEEFVYDDEGQLITQQLPRLPHPDGDGDAGARRSGTSRRRRRTPRTASRAAARAAG